MGLKSQYRVKQQQKYRARRKRQKLMAKTAASSPGITPPTATAQVSPVSP